VSDVTQNCRVLFRPVDNLVLFYFQLEVSANFANTVHILTLKHPVTVTCVLHLEILTYENDVLLIRVNLWTNVSYR